MKTTPIFVFGSNLAGRHDKGAALYAKVHHGAIYGQGYGLQGRSFAIPTKDSSLKTLPLWCIKEFVDSFIDFAIEHPEYQFRLTRIGCGLTGYQDFDIVPMLKNTPNNVIKPPGW